MGQISQIVNNLSCGAGSLMGTGTKFCPQDIKNPKVVVFAEKGTKFEPSVNFNLLTLQELQQKGKIIILNGIVSFTDNTAENETATRDSTGIKYTTMLPPYDLTFVFDNGIHFHKALTKLQGSKNYDMFIFDVKNDMFGAQDRQGNFRGLDCLYVGVGGYKMGKENAQSLMVQLSRSQFDSDVAWISNENLDFTAEQDLDGYNDVEIVITAPTNTDTSLSFKVYAVANNKKVALTGLELSDFLLKIDGVSVTADTLVAGTEEGDYSLTDLVLSTGDTISLQLFDSLLNASIVNLDGTMYKSNLATSVVL